MSFYDQTHDSDPTWYQPHMSPFHDTHIPSWLLPPIQSDLNAPVFEPHYQAFPSHATSFPSSSPPNHTRPLYASIPLPSSKPFPQATHLSPYLAPGTIDWTIRSPPASASYYAQQRHPKAIPYAWQQECATSPAQPFMVLQVSGRSDTITVLPRDPHGTFVTVGDVLACVHHAPNCTFGVAAAECRCPRCVAFVSRARYARSRAGGMAGVPQGSALMAVDHGYGLQTQRVPAEGSRGVDDWRWLGLVASTTEPEVWTLLLDTRRGLVA